MAAPYLKFSSRETRRNRTKKTTETGNVSAGSHKGVQTIPLLRPKSAFLVSTKTENWFEEGPSGELCSRKRPTPLARRPLKAEVQHLGFRHFIDRFLQSFKKPGTSRERSRIFSRVKTCDQVTGNLPQDSRVLCRVQPFCLTTALGSLPDSSRNQGCHRRVMLSRFSCGAAKPFSLEIIEC